MELVEKRNDVQFYYDPGSINSMLAMANKFIKSGAFAETIKNPEQAFVVLQTGKEMGMPPMESMRSLYIVNGHVTIWGMALSKRLREFGWEINYPISTTEKCKVVISRERDGRAEEHQYEVDEEDLKLIQNKRAYKMDPKSKLRWHALSRLVRFSVPEVLGPVQYTKEEMEDFSGKTVELGGEGKPISKKSELKLIFDKIKIVRDIRPIESKKNDYNMLLGFVKQNWIKISGESVNLGLSEKQSLRIQKVIENLYRNVTDNNTSCWIENAELVSEESLASYKDFKEWAVERCSFSGSDGAEDVVNAVQLRKFDGMELILDSDQNLEIYELVKKLTNKAGDLL